MNFKLGTQNVYEDPYHRPVPWPPRSKVKVARLRNASDRCWPISRERNVTETPKLVRRTAIKQFVKKSRLMQYYYYYKCNSEEFENWDANVTMSIRSSFLSPFSRSYSYYCYWQAEYHNSQGFLSAANNTWETSRRNDYERLLAVCI